MRNPNLDPDPEFHTIQEFVANEPINLWANLYNAHCWTHGNDGYPWRDREWSMECDALACRIRGATRFVGPISWQDIGTPHLFGDRVYSEPWFQWACGVVGVACILPTPEEYKGILKHYIPATGGHKL